MIVSFVETRVFDFYLVHGLMSVLRRDYQCNMFPPWHYFFHYYNEISTGKCKNFFQRAQLKCSTLELSSDITPQSKKSTKFLKSLKSKNLVRS